MDTDLIHGVAMQGTLGQRTKTVKGWQQNYGLYLRMSPLFSIGVPSMMLKISVAWSLISKQLNPVLNGPYLPPSDPASRLPHPALCPRGMDVTYKVIHCLPCPAPSGWPMGSPGMKGRVKSGFLPSWLPACQLEKPPHLLQ